jgi:hypothetical protein
MGLGYRLCYLKNNWKLVLHLLLGTKHFGVNNERWSSFPSMFGKPWWKIAWGIITVRPLIKNCKLMKFRAKIGFVHPDTLDKLGWGDKSKTP